MRCSKENFFSEIRKATGGDQWIERVTQNGNTLKIRVVNIEIGGTKETLITNLQNDEFTSECIAEIYNKRWAIETLYNDIKNKVQIENFTGASKIAVLQDIYATIALNNMVATIELDSQEELEAVQSDKDLLYKYKINRAIAIGKFSMDYYDIFLDSSNIRRLRKLKKLIADLEKSVVAVSPDRHFERKRKSFSRKFPQNMKSSL